ncbi:unnamed protein product [Moneuplotes crassus]|uniref:Uncharacterized protein n=1 Tax=Euplotes crassus TaxID=5936 RepID=A0AAD1XL31_EUPCR|nr:unnamed protein product [Moneuplotes crassus]
MNQYFCNNLNVQVNNNINPNTLSFNNIGNLSINPMNLTSYQKPRVGRNMGSYATAENTINEEKYIRIPQSHQSKMDFYQLMQQLCKIPAKKSKKKQSKTKKTSYLKGYRPSYNPKLKPRYTLSSKPPTSKPYKPKHRGQMKSKPSKSLHKSLFSCTSYKNQNPKYLTQTTNSGKKKGRKKKRCSSNFKNSLKLNSTDLPRLLSSNNGMDYLYSNDYTESIYSEQDFGMSEQAYAYDHEDLEAEIMKVKIEKSSLPINICLDTKAFQAFK